ncbi:MAG TPA: FHA domain-containing protein [Polyangiales bacterium]|nr:FHA domain-containing protein [Polyangiales bacterium]
MARFRLRFLLQELELLGPVITLGRSSDCQITIDDPLVSRVHAELMVSDTGVKVRDLGSRNGVRINDVLIHGEASLADKDRLRLGSQDLVFLAVSEVPGRASAATGALAYCAECDRPFPAPAKACPRCGARNKSSFGPELDTETGVELVEGPSWTFRLIAEVLERALAAGRAPEATRMLERAARDIDARVRAGRKLGSEQLRDASSYALRLAKLTHDPAWATWAVALHTSERRLPAAETLSLIEQLDPGTLRIVSPSLEALLRDPLLIQQSGVVEDTRRIENLVRRVV